MKLSMALVMAGAGIAMAVQPAAPEAPGADAGRALFADKQCVRCHRLRGEQAVGPSLEVLRRPQGEMELAGRLWNHVPAMFVTLGQEGFRWPGLSVAEMAALMAYLQADAARDPAPDLFKGQVTLVRKGCLKCHSLRREGGRVEPDLAERRSDYESAAAWASAMWAHAPRMAELAARLGIPYPRFSGDEMGNLLGFLRRAAVTAPGSGPRTPSRP